MNYLLLSFIFTTLTGCGIAPKEASKAPIINEIHINNLDESARNLLQHQEENFDRILKELNEHNKKVSHWIWWIFPTDMPGNSEPYPKSSVSLSQAQAVLTKARLDKWTGILETMASLLENNSQSDSPKRPNPAIIPPIDYGRIAYSLDFWLRKVGDETKKYESFYQALKRLDAFTWR